MPSRCYVPGCRSNYENKGKTIPTFRFPSNEDRRKQWIEVIKRKDFQPTKHSTVCLLHFESRFLLLEDSMTREDGTFITAKRRAGLTKDAYPTIFPNWTKYLTRKFRKPRKNSKERKAKHDEPSRLQFHTEKNHRCLHCGKSFARKNYLSRHMHIHSGRVESLKGPHLKTGKSEDSLERVDPPRKKARMGEPMEDPSSQNTNRRLISVEPFFSHGPAPYYEEEKHLHTSSGLEAGGSVKTEPVWYYSCEDAMGEPMRMSIQAEPGTEWWDDLKFELAVDIKEEPLEGTMSSRVR